MFNSHFNRSKSEIKNSTEITLNLPLNLIEHSSDKANFPHTLLLTDMQVSRICKAFANGLSANIRLPKTQLSKMVQLGGVIRDIHVLGNILLSVTKEGTDIARGLGKNFLNMPII